MKYLVFIPLFTVILLVEMHLVDTAEISLTITECPTIEVDYHVAMFTMHLSEAVDSPVTFQLESDHTNIAYPLKESVTFQPSDGITPKVLFVYGANVGYANIKVYYNDTRVKLSDRNGGIDVLVVHSLFVTTVIQIFGWIYFVAWAISFYPQLYTNFKRKSVTGLSFDFLCYNFIGYFAYSAFNVGLFYFQTVQDEYFDKYGGSVIPVLSNDVFVGLHSLTLTTIAIVQCFIYERGDQKVSLMCKLIVGSCWLFALCSLIPTLMSKITWLMYLNFFSYIKLSVTLVKCVPQFYMNYKRKSTIGFSIESVLTDLIGASFSLVQMFLLAYNNNVWNSIFGDLTKFGLGFLSIVIDVIFTLQHYVFYPKLKTYEVIPD